MTYNNATGYNATSGLGYPGSGEPADWPLYPEDFKKLNYLLPVASTNGDFPGPYPAGWHLIPNATHVYSYWNMTVPPTGPFPLLPRPLLPGAYEANLSATIADAGNPPV